MRWKILLPSGNDNVMGSGSTTWFQWNQRMVSIGKAPDFSTSFINFCSIFSFFSSLSLIFYPTYAPVTIIVVKSDPSTLPYKIGNQTPTNVIHFEALMAIATATIPKKTHWIYKKNLWKYFGCTRWRSAYRTKSNAVLSPFICFMLLLLLAAGCSYGLVFSLWFLNWKSEKR